MSERWLSELGSFVAANGWRTFIVCTNGGAHVQELLGLAFEHADFTTIDENGNRVPEVHWSPRLVSDDDSGSVRQLILLTRVWAINESTAEERNMISQRRGRGSVNASCPHGCTWRIPRAEWDRVIHAAARVSLQEPLDLSRIV